MLNQKVSINAGRLLTMVTILAALSAANLIVTVLQGSDISAVKKDTGDIKTKVIPLCLTPGAVDACAEQVNIAPQPAVIRLCKTVHAALNLPPEQCSRPEFNGKRGKSGDNRTNQELQSGDSTGASTTPATGSGDSTAIASTDPTSPPPSDGDPGGGSNPPPDDPGTDPPPPPPPPVLPPPAQPEQPIVGTSTNTCVAGTCAGANASLGSSGVGAGVGVGNVSANVHVP